MIPQDDDVVLQVHQADGLDIAATIEAPALKNIHVYLKRLRAQLTPSGAARWSLL